MTCVIEDGPVDVGYMTEEWTSHRGNHAEAEALRFTRIQAANKPRGWEWYRGDSCRSIEALGLLFRADVSARDG